MHERSGLRKEALKLLRTCRKKRGLQKPQTRFPRQRTISRLSITGSNSKYAGASWTVWFSQLMDIHVFEGPSSNITIHRVRAVHFLFLLVVDGSPQTNSIYYVSPCAAASKASMDCLNRNNYDRDSCLDYFRAYRDCKKLWVRLSRVFVDIVNLSVNFHFMLGRTKKRGSACGTTDIIQ